ncbi:hypothetical protein ACFLYF_06785 [Chloroflexota bacterium]
MSYRWYEPVVMATPGHIPIILEANKMVMIVMKGHNIQLSI